MTIRLNGSTSGYTEIDAPAVAGSNTLVLPTGNGTSGQVLTTNGSGALSWAGAGKILQVVQAVKTDTFSRTSSGSDYGDITGLSVSITPSSTSSKILVLASVNCSNGTAGNRMGIRLAVNSSAITAITGDASSTRTRATSATWTGSAGNDLSHLAIKYLHSPSSVSAQTYSVQGSGEANSVFWCNRSGTNADSNSVYLAASSIIAMEVAA